MDLLLAQIWRTSVSTWLTPELNTAITWYIVSLCGPFCMYVLIYLLKMYFCCHGVTQLFSVSVSRVREKVAIIDFHANGVSCGL